MAVIRPNPALWVWYAFGGRLPDRHREWVLRDLTARTWLWRFAARSLLRLLPLVLVTSAVLWLVLDAPVGLAIGSVAIGLLVGFYFSLSYAVENAENRAAQHGYELGTAQRLRNQNAAARDPEQQARYDAAWRTPGG